MAETGLSVVDSSFDATIARFDKIKELATYLSKSEAFMKGFESKDKDGKIILNEDGTPVINVADVAICLMTGHEIGLDIGGSLLYGKKLNQATYQGVLKGRSLGIDIATSIEKVVAIPTQNGYVTYTMVDIISAKLIEAGVEYLPFIKNYAPYYIYTLANTTDELEYDKIMDRNDDLLPEYFLVHAGLAKEDVTKARNEGKILITRVQHGYYSKAIFTRKFPDGHVLTHVQRFSTLDAERAGLLPVWGLAADGKTTIELSKGKSNWISNTPQMMNNRVLSIGGRIIVADQLKGVYTREEVISSGLVKEEDARIIDIEASEIK